MAGFSAIAVRKIYEKKKKPSMLLSGFRYAKYIALNLLGLAHGAGNIPVFPVLVRERCPTV